MLLQVSFVIAILKSIQILKRGILKMKTQTILITGAGSGLGKLTALTLAKIGHKVIATTETVRQAALLEDDARTLKIPLIVEKIDITHKKDREKAWSWDIDILVNNAGVSEGGALVDIPEENFRKQYEVNVFGTLLLTQGFIRKMVQKKSGRIIFVSSISGLMANAFSGPYVSSKYALEGIASTLSQELLEYDISVAIINPGPYLTGFNDEEFEKYRTWPDGYQHSMFNPEQISFPLKQYAPKEAIAPMVRVILGETKAYRNVIPKRLTPLIMAAEKYEWIRKSNWFLGKRHPLVDKALKMDPATRK